MINQKNRLVIADASQSQEIRTICPNPHEPYGRIMAMVNWVSDEFTVPSLKLFSGGGVV